MQIPAKQNQTKVISRLKIILAIACLLSGLLAGENVFRYAIEVPGWRHIDIRSWGEYSRHADLKAGTFLFSLEAVISGILGVIASVILLKNKNEFRRAAFPVFLAAFFSLTGLALTFFAAPYMLSVKTMSDDPLWLQQTFDHFHFWGFYRAIAQVLSFFASVWGMGKVYELHLK